MLNETEKKFMREQFLEMVENAKEISSEIAVAEEKLSQEFCKLEEQIGRNFTYGEITDIIADYEQHKHGRTITGFTFKFKQKTKPKTVKSDKIARDLNTVDMFITMTDNQRFSFAKKISQLHEASHLAKGLSNQSYEAFAEQISKDLLDRNKQKIYLPFLEKLGFQSER